MLETPAAGQLFADSMIVVRGWVVQTKPPILGVLVEAPGLRVELPLDRPRGDVIEAQRCHGIVGFEGRIDLINQACRATLVFSFLRAHGRRQSWQSVEVWHPEMRPAAPARSVLGLDWSRQAAAILGRLRGSAAEDTVSLWQDGHCIATARPDQDGAFQFSTQGLEPLQDAFLWNDAADGQATLMDCIIGTGPMREDALAPAQPRRLGMSDILLPRPTTVNGRPVNVAAAADGSAWFRTEALSDTLWLGRLEHAGQPGVFLNQTFRWVRTAREAVIAKRLVQLETIDGTRTVFAPCAIEHGPEGFVLLGLRDATLPMLEVPVTALRDLRPLASPFERDALIEAEIQMFRTRYATLKRRQALAAPEAAGHRRLVLPARLDAVPADLSGRCVLLRPEHSPTDDLYVTAAMEQFGQRRGWSYRIINLDDAAAQLDPGAIRAGDCVIVSRYINEPWFQRLAAFQGRIRIVYLMDDDVAAAIDSPALPVLYRQRMDEVALLDFQAMLRLADHFVVTSEGLLRKYQSPKTRLLHPPCLRFPQSMAHQDVKRPIRVAYHGTDGHREDIGFLSGVLIQLAQKLGARTEVEIFSTFRFPTNLPNIRFVKPKPWAQYISHAESNPAHICVVPLLSTPYNLGKSIIKMHDTTALGAVGVYSKMPPYDGVVRDGEDGLLVANDPGLWYQALRLLVEQHALRQAMASSAQERARRDFSPTATAEFWEALLGIT
ncbi:MAG: hypothetical protein K5Q68_09135 [Roseococcus sp.]|nr:hypothetical protein [Roseococcus sp.]